jgi:hypothetical protein
MKALNCQVDKRKIGYLFLNLDWNSDHMILKVKELV